MLRPPTPDVREGHRGMLIDYVAAAAIVAAILVMLLLWQADLGVLGVFAMGLSEDCGCWQSASSLAGVDCERASGA